MKKRIMTGVAVLLTLLVLIAAGMLITQYWKDKDATREEVRQRLEYAYLMGLINESGGNRGTFRTYYNDPYYYRQVTFAMERTRQAEEYEVILCPSSVTPLRVDWLNDHLAVNGKEIAGYDGTTSLIDMNDVIENPETVQEVLDSLGEAAEFRMRIDNPKPRMDMI